LFLLKRLCGIGVAVNGHFAIRHLFAILAVAGLVLSPMARPVMAMPTDLRASIGDPVMVHDIGPATPPADMQCCPEKSPASDCGKDCPFMALCGAKILTPVRLVSLFVLGTLVSCVVPGNEAELRSIAEAPPTKPPKT
jgi:hypothetical protein